MSNTHSMAGSDIHEVIEEIDAGTLAARLSRMISDCAAATHDTKKVSQVSLTLDLKKGEGADEQIIVTAKAKYKHPTLIGEKSELVNTKVSMFVGARGRLSLARPIADNDMFDGQHSKEA